MSRQASVVVVVALSVTPVVSAAQTIPTRGYSLTTATPTPVPVAYPDFSSMQFLVGTWTCTQPWRGRTRTETNAYAISKDRMWMVDSTSSPPFDQYRTIPRNGTLVMTYDAAVAQWIAMYYDNLGSYAMESSPGWEGNVANWSGKGLDGRSFTDVITKVSDTHTTDASTLTDARGKTITVTITCKKNP